MSGVGQWGQIKVPRGPTRTPGAQDHRPGAEPAAPQKAESEPSQHVPTNENRPHGERGGPGPSQPLASGGMNGRGAGIGRGPARQARRPHKGGAGGRARRVGRARAQRPGTLRNNQPPSRPARPPGQQTSRPGNPSPHRELFLLLGSTPLKVVVVVMAPKERGRLARSRAERWRQVGGAQSSSPNQSRRPLQGLRRGLPDGPPLL